MYTRLRTNWYSSLRSFDMWHDLMSRLYDFSRWILVVQCKLEINEHRDPNRITRRGFDRRCRMTFKKDGSNLPFVPIRSNLGLDPEWIGMLCFVDRLDSLGVWREFRAFPSVLFDVDVGPHVWHVG